MHSIRDIVTQLNKSFTWLPVGSEVNGVAELLLRDEVTIPVINERYVGIDDVFPVRIYHRLNSMNSKPFINSEKKMPAKEARSGD